MVRSCLKRALVVIAAPSGASINKHPSTTNLPIIIHIVEAHQYQLHFLCWSPYTPLSYHAHTATSANATYTGDQLTPTNAGETPLPAHPNPSHIKDLNSPSSSSVQSHLRPHTVPTHPHLHIIVYTIFIYCFMPYYHIYIYHHILIILSILIKIQNKTF